MGKKVCSSCNIEKNLIDFGNLKSSKDGLMYHCRECNTKKQLLYRKKHESTYKIYLSKNKEKISEYLKIYNKKNKEEIIKKRKTYYKENKDKILSVNKEYHKKNVNKIRVRKKNYTKQKRSSDIMFKLKETVRKRILNFIKTKNIKKNFKTFEIIGCTPEFLIKHLEQQFSFGMSWENKSEWHIDHIIPLSSAKNENELYKLCHYTNLQPLWAKENIKKSNKILII
jgi:hypothetical protein